MVKRNIYLDNVPVEEALLKYFSALKGILEPKTEVIPVEESLNRITSSAVYARLSSPLYNAAAMDGIAVRAADTEGARDSSPLTLKEGENFTFVDTGDPVHYPHDAVIMAEELIQTGEEEGANHVCVKIMEAASPWQHIRPIGEDIVAGEMIITGRHIIRPIDIGVLFSGGITSIKVFSKPKVAIIPTGTEIIDTSVLMEYDRQGLQSPKEGEIIESNSRMFEAQVKRDGGEGKRFSPIEDDYEKLKEMVIKAADEFDMVLINAGSSAGTEDFTVQVLREIGEVIIHGVAMKPGKPVILARVNNKPVIGTPGYPVSAYLAYETFTAPVLAVLSGAVTGENIAVNGEKIQTNREQEAGISHKIEAVITKRVVSSLKAREYVRVKVGRVNGKLVASPLARGAGAAMSLVRADGFCVIDQQSEGIEAGEIAAVELFRSMKEIERTLVAIGSHDLILDIIADMLFCGGTASLSSAHTGSLAGLNALRRGECHIAPIHLLDEETGCYNAGWIRKIFQITDKNEQLSISGEQLKKRRDHGKNVCLIKGVGRIQGLIVRKGNPLNIKTLGDICKCRFINRQRGAGTRIFLDYLLKNEGISSADINGYKREAATHMAVAAAVQGGSADAGLGIASVANALNIDFIPLGEEEYDFAIFSDTLKLNNMTLFIKILKSPGFHEKLTELGRPYNAYTWSKAGEIINIE